MEQGMIDLFVNAIKQEPNDTKTTYSAIVSRIDEEGVIWVYVAGADKDTPTAQTGVEVKKGDNVTVEWRNNKLYIAGNYSNPAAGMARVVNVEMAAQAANQAAQNAVADAGRAREAADNALATAESVRGIAADAQTSADKAKAAAGNASEYAARALGNLSTVQNVAETLNWITSHGTMTLTTDTALDPSHVYFVRDNNGDYTVGSYRYSVVTEPNVADISTYYELSIDESLNNYIATHLSLTDEGLYIATDNSDWKVLIKSNGIFLINGTDTVSHFSDYIKLGGNNSSGVILNSAETDFIGSDGNLVGRISYGELGVVRITDLQPEWSGRYFEEPLIKEAILSSVPEGETSLTWNLNGVEHTHAFDATRDYSGTQDQIAITYSRTNLELTATYLGDYLEYTFLTERKPSVSEVGILVPVEPPEPSFVYVSPGLFGEAISKNATYLPAYHLYQTYTLKYTPLQGSKIKINMVLVNPTEVEFTAGNSETKTIGYGSWITLKVIYDAQSNSIRIEYVSGTSYAYVESLSYSNKLVDASIGELVYDSQISMPNYIFGSGEPTSRNFTYRFGENLIIGDDNQLIVGRNNEVTEDIFIIGNGESRNHRSNALTLTKEGDMKLALNTTATTGVDKEIYDALVSLGWDSDVIV